MNKPGQPLAGEGAPARGQSGETLPSGAREEGRSRLTYDTFDIALPGLDGALQVGGVHLPPAPPSGVDLAGFCLGKPTSAPDTSRSKSRKRSQAAAPYVGRDGLSKYCIGEKPRQ